MASEATKVMLDRLTLMLSVIATLTAVIAALNTDRPSSVIAFLLIAALAFSTHLLYVWRARTAAGLIKYPRLRGTLCLGVFFVTCLGVDTIAVPASREYLMYDILGLPNVRKDVHIEKIAISRSSNAYRLEVTLSNRGAKKLLASRLELLLQVKKVTPTPRPSPSSTTGGGFTSINGCNNGCSRADPEYEVMERIRLIVGESGQVKVRGSVAELDKDGSPGEFASPIEGTAVCEQGPILNFVMPTSFVLEPAGYTLARIDIPKKFDVESPPGLTNARDFVTTALLPLNDPLDVYSFDGFAEYGVAVYMAPDDIPITRRTAFMFEGERDWDWGW